MCLSCGYAAVQTIEFDEGAGAVLRIQPLRAPRDENIYECVARNSEGEVSVTAKLAIIRGETQKSTHTHTLSPSFSTRAVLSFHMHTPDFSFSAPFPGLSVVDVTMEPCHTQPPQQAAVNCSFFSPSECDRA